MPNLLWLILLQAIVFILILWLVLWLIHRISIKRKGFPLTKQNLSVVHQREIRLSLPYEQAFNICKEAINQLSRITFKQEDYSTGTLIANSRITWSSFGEQIIFNIDAIDDNKTQVRFTSRPLVSTTKFDYGKNLENIERIRHYLMSYVS